MTCKWKCYTVRDMTFPIRAYWPEAPRTKESAAIAVALAVLLTGMVVAQLFSFEEFVSLFADVPGGMVFPAIIVALEIAALPFLLRMKLSSGFRVFSLLSGWAMIGYWLIMAIMTLGGTSENQIGFLGTVVELQPGIWAVFVVGALGVLMAWASWGLLPVRNTSTLKHS